MPLAYAVIATLVAIFALLALEELTRRNWAPTRDICYRYNRWSWNTRRAVATWLVERLVGEDMLWNDDDPELYVGSVEEWAHENWSPGDNGPEKFQRAFGLPTREYEITWTKDEDDDWEVEAECKPDHRWSHTLFFVTLAALAYQLIAPLATVLAHALGGWL